MMASGSYDEQDFYTIHVGNIPPEVTSRRLKIYFETFGPVVYVSFPQTGTQYSTHQYYFVAFKEESDAEKALSDPHHSVHFEGIKVNPVRWNQPAEDRISILDLNDDCLIQIASKLSFLDLLRLSQVWQGFKCSADFQFSKCKNLDARLFRECRCTLMEIREIMSRVGPSVQKVKFSHSDMEKIDDYGGQYFLNCLAEFCSNLRILECHVPVRYHEAYRNMFRAFKNLTALSLPHCDITDAICEAISNCENIENLNLSRNRQITGKYLHNLIKLKILNLQYCKSLWSIHFNELLANVKLESLNIKHCDWLQQSSIEHLLKHQTELVTLSVTKRRGSLDLYPLAKLKSIKNLEVDVDYSSDLILEELAFHNTGVEILKVTFRIMKASQKEAILNLENLMELCIEGVDDSFLNQIASRTSLRYFCCSEYHFHENVTSYGILNLIRISNTIEKIGLYSDKHFGDLPQLIDDAIDILKEKQRATRLTFVIRHTYTDTIEWMQMDPKFMENSHLVDFEFKLTHSHSDFDF